MTYRERKEARLQRRLDWATSRDQKAAQGFARASEIASHIPFGQPILIGHHSEGRMRSDLAKIDAGMRAGCESSDMAATHRAKAVEIERQLDRSVYSDDDNAIEALQARIAEHEADRDRRKTVNKLYKKADVEGLASLGITYATIKAKLDAERLSWMKVPYPAYELTNLGARIRTDKKRVEEITARNHRAAQAETSGGVLIEHFDGQTPKEWCRVTFSEKPDRATLDALKAAGFHWGAGAWVGKTADLPALNMEN